MDELKACELDEARKVLWYCGQFVNYSNWANQYHKALTVICDELDRRAAPENKLQCDGCENQKRDGFNYEVCVRCKRHWPDHYARKPEGSKP